MTYNWVVFEM